MEAQKPKLFGIAWVKWCRMLVICLHFDFKFLKKYMTILFCSYPKLKRKQVQYFALYEKNLGTPR